MNTLRVKVPPHRSGKPSFPRMTLSQADLRLYRKIQQAWGADSIKLEGELLQRHKLLLGGWTHEGESQWDRVKPGEVMAALLAEVEALHTLLEDALARAEGIQP